MSTAVSIEAIVISEDYNFTGYRPGASGISPPQYLLEAQLIAGKGIQGDRYAQRRSGHNKQITFFDSAHIDALSAWCGRAVLPEQVRRNVFVRGADLPSLVGQAFTLQGISFEGIEPCHPCYWMDHSIFPGAEDFLAGKGGLRARILTDGLLRLGAAELVVEGPRR